MISELEKALFYASEAGDIKSLKALARQESSRAENFRRIACALLDAAGGPVNLRADPLTYAEREILITFEATKAGGVATLRLSPS